MIHIIGVDHLVQYNGPVPDHLRVEFREFVMAASRDLGIRLIAEEFSREALEIVYGATVGTAREAAEQLGIDHRFCDPEEHDLKRLGIPYFADMMDMVKREAGIVDSFILDQGLRSWVREETAARLKAFWEIRESFWLDRISDALDLNILFICGHEHACRFHRLVIQKGHESRIITRFWRKEIFEHYRNIGL